LHQQSHFQADFNLDFVRIREVGVGWFKLLLCGLITVSVKSRSDDGLRPIDDRQSFSLIRRASAMQLTPTRIGLSYSYKIKMKICVKM
jgi:hypothetical protein